MEGVVPERVYQSMSDHAFGNRITRFDITSTPKKYPSTSCYERDVPDRAFINDNPIRDHHPSRGLALMNNNGTHPEQARMGHYSRRSIREKYVRKGEL
jgi:hypothetical protein